MSTTKQKTEDKPHESSSTEQILYMNGKFIPQAQAVVSIRDMGFFKGDSVFDCCRTVKHKPFKLEEHIERLYCSLKYVKIDVGLSPAEMKQICYDVLDKNVQLLNENDDFWIFMRVTRGIPGPDFPLGLANYKPTIIVYCSPINFKKIAKLYQTGRKLITSSIRMLPAECLEPRLKSTCRQHFMLACAHVQEQDPEAWPLLLDIDGNIAEPYGANIFFVSKGKLMTPAPEMILNGVTRQTVIELAGELRIPVIEGSHFKPYDVYVAEEAFITTTSWKILPVCSLDGIRIGKNIPGSMTELLLKEFSKKIGVNIVEQALSHLSEEEHHTLE